MPASLSASLPVLSRRDLFALLLAAPVAVRSYADAPAEWIALFDGRTLEGWKASEHQGTFTVADGCIVAHGGRSHLFYTGPAHRADFKNFEFSADVQTRPGANSGVYFHTAFQPEGWPRAGFEVQVANTYPGDNRKTGSLYGVRNVYKQFAPDNRWFNLKILVRGKQVALVDQRIYRYHVIPGDCRGVDQSVHVLPGLVCLDLEIRADVRVSAVVDYAVAQCAVRQVRLLVLLHVAGEQPVAVLEQVHHCQAAVGVQQRCSQL